MPIFMILILLLSLAGCNTQKRGTAKPSASSTQQKPAAPPVPDVTPADAKGPTAPQKAPTPKKESNESAVVLTPPGKENPIPASSVVAPKPVAPLAQPAVAAPAPVVPVMNLIELTFEETSHTYSLIGRYYGKNGPAVLTPMMGMGSKEADFTYELTGGFEEATLTMKKKGYDFIKFNDVKFNLKEPIRTQSGDYILLGTCVGGECEIIVASVYKKANGKVVENYPMYFKLVDKGYKPARLMEEKAFAERVKKEEADAQDPSKAPPQLRVAYLLAQNTNKHSLEILKDLRKTMKDQSAIYSARLFTNLKTRTCDPDFKIDKNSASVKINCEFTEMENRKPLAFSGNLLPDLTELNTSEGVKLTISTIKAETNLEKGLGFYMLTYKQDNFKSPIENVKQALQSRLCQVLVEKAVVYSECEYIPSSVALDAMALEGHFDGPFYVGDKNFLRDNKTVSEPKIIKTRDELPKKEKPVATDGV